MVEIFLNDILIKKVYSDVILNLPDKEHYEKKNAYNITDSTFPLISNIKITVKIFDLNQIDNVYFNVTLEKIQETKVNSELETIPIEFISTTHELLYEGIKSNITINMEYGYYQSIYIVCENILDNISSVSLTNNDVILYKDIPLILLDHNKNLILYTLKENSNINSGIKIDKSNSINIEINKNNHNSKIKIYGSKLVIIKKRDNN